MDERPAIPARRCGSRLLDLAGQAEWEAAQVIRLDDLARRADAPDTIQLAAGQRTLRQAVQQLGRFGVPDLACELRELIVRYPQVGPHALAVQPHRRPEGPQVAVLGARQLADGHPHAADALAGLLERWPAWLWTAVTGCGCLDGSPALLRLRYDGLLLERP